MATPTVYVICDQNCKYEGMTREQILAAITQAVESGTISDVDTGFVQTIKTINGHALKFFVGEQSEYDALTDEDKKDLFAIITNDTTKEGLFDAINTLQTEFNEFKNGIESGAVSVPKATSAANATALTEGWTNAGTITVTTNDYSGTKLPDIGDNTLYAIKILIASDNGIGTFYNYVTVLMGAMGAMGGYDNTAYSTLAPYPKNNQYMMFIKDFGAYGYHLMMIDTTTGSEVNLELTVTLYYKKIC